MILGWDLEQAGQTERLCELARVRLQRDSRNETVCLLPFVSAEKFSTRIRKIFTPLPTSWGFAAQEGPGRVRSESLKYESLRLGLWENPLKFSDATREEKPHLCISGICTHACTHMHTCKHTHTITHTHTGFSC